MGKLSLWGRQLALVERTLKEVRLLPALIAAGVRSPLLLKGGLGATSQNTVQETKPYEE